MAGDQLFNLTLTRSADGEPILLAEAETATYLSRDGREWVSTGAPGFNSFSVLGAGGVVYDVDGLSDMGDPHVLAFSTDLVTWANVDDGRLPLADLSFDEFGGSTRAIGGGDLSVIVAVHEPDGAVEVWILKAPA
jgi:hypothetical protein